MTDCKSRKSDTFFRSHTFWLLTVVAVGILLTLLVFYPGYMSPDSVSQLSQGRSGEYDDWHPPVMSWLWGRLDLIVPGPLGMLLFHNLLYWSGLSLWIALVAERLHIAVKCIAVLAIGLFPPIFALLSTIWKDVGMAAAFLLASALFLYAERRQAMGSLFLGLLAIWYGVAARHNGIIAAVPLVYYASKIMLKYRFVQKATIRRHRRLATGLCALVMIGLLLSTSSAAGRQLTHGRTQFPIQQILVHDLTAISIDAGAVLLPAYQLMPQAPTVEDLEVIYTPEGVVPLFSSQESDTALKIAAEPDRIDNLRSMWINSVLSYPTAYLVHRLRVFGTQLGVIGEDVCYPYQYGISRNSLGVSYKGNATTISLKDFFWKNRSLFQGWPYLATCILILTYLLLSKDRPSIAPPAMAAMAASGTFYGLAYVFVATSCDFRMYWWTAVSAVTLAVSLAALLVQTRSRRRRES